ncbi:MAG: AAA family ATPase [Minisyncoccia bacterium]
MKIIEKIEIKHFRSFLGTPKLFEVNVNNLTNLNVFSGANDSGKSNILRALNLFFNNEISSGTPLEFDRDFFVSDKDTKHKVIEISISFNLSSDNNRDRFLPEKFTISKFYDRNGFRNYTYIFFLKEKSREIKIDSRSENNDAIKDLFITEESTEEEKENVRKREWNYRVKFSGFLNKSVSFEYVPAIRDKNFFAQLFGRVITKVKTNEDARIEDLNIEKNKIQNWEKTIKNKTERNDFKDNLKKKVWRESRLNEIENLKITESKLAVAIGTLESEINNYSGKLLSSVNFLDSEFKIGKNLRDFFEGFDVGTGLDKSISLKLRGDGIQAKFVPKILDFLSSIDSEKKYFLWGFEEPENSAEYKNQQELASQFKNTFSSNKQIFITTHSEEFLQLYDGIEIAKNLRKANLYHVRKISNSVYGEHSMIFLFDVDKNEFDFASQKTFLEDDLGQSYLRAKYSKEIKKQEDAFISEKMQIQKDFSVIVEKIRKPIVYSEGNNTAYIKKAKEFFAPRLDFDIETLGGKTDIKKFFIRFADAHFDRFKILFVFDCDAIAEFNICNARKTDCLIPFIFSNNIKNTEEEVQCGIENLFNSELFSEEKELFTVNEHVRDGITKSRNRELRKEEFQNLICNERNEESDFENFKPLFQKIDELF